MRSDAASFVPDPPRASRSTERADWLVERLDFWAWTWTGIVANGFPAYARLLHPLSDEPGGPCWADVAALTGRTVDGTVEWEHLAARGDGWEQSFTRSDPSRYLKEPARGALEPWALAEVCDVLSAHTSTADHCYFGVWEGWGGLHGGSSFTIAWPEGTPRTLPTPPPPEWQIGLSGPRFSIPGREYHLFEGRLEQANSIGRVTGYVWEPQPPSFIWPADHAWCVSTEVDLDSTVIGGSAGLVEALRRHPTLEVLPLPADARRGT